MKSIRLISKSILNNAPLTEKSISVSSSVGKKKVFVGMSGGVDSSVSAALLKEQGCDVTGVFIKVWQPDFMPCNWKEERRDAMRVAAHLSIPFITLDLEKEYKEEVVDYMINEYKMGRTPNPDVMCNRYVKFGGFFDWAMEQGADFVATGHYARVDGAHPYVEPNSRPNFLGDLTTQKGEEFHARVDGRHLDALESQGAVLLKGRDDNKDQSYFLWTLTGEKLAKTLFPVGDIEKPEVRELARKFKLPNAEKKDSQGLCFVGKIDMKDFLKHYINEKPGDVLDEQGEVIGHHTGALFYTLGERRGFTITEKSPDDKPYFVIAKDNEKNTLTVSNDKLSGSSSISNAKKSVDGKETEMIPSSSADEIISLKDTNWILETHPEKIYKARVRYRGTLHDVKIKTLSENKAEVSFVNSSDVIAPGQSIVVYEGEVCVGGGIIA